VKAKVQIRAAVTLWLYRGHAHQVHRGLTRLAEVELRHFELVLGGLEVGTAVVRIMSNISGSTGTIRMLWRCIVLCGKGPVQNAVDDLEHLLRGLIHDVEILDLGCGTA
jgi:hypothetical protein